MKLSLTSLCYQLAFGDHFWTRTMVLGYLEMMMKVTTISDSRKRKSELDSEGDGDQSIGLCTLISEVAIKKPEEDPDESKGSGASLDTIVNLNSRLRSATSSFRSDDDSWQDYGSTSFRTNTLKKIIKQKKKEMVGIASITNWNNILH